MKSLKSIYEGIELELGLSLEEARRGTISRQVAFRTLNRIRANQSAERDRAEKTFIVWPVTKDGRLYKTEPDLRFYGYKTREEAQVGLAMHISMNPGHRYTIVER